MFPSTILPALVVWTAVAAAVTGAIAQEPAAPRCSARQPWPERFTLDYLVAASRGALALEGDSQLTYTVDSGRYQLRSSTRSLGYRAEQTSRGELAGTVLRPLEYVEQNQRREPRVVRFDWDARSVTFSANPDEPGRTLPMLQDRLSVLLQLGQRLRTQAQNDIELPVAGLRRISPYRFERYGQERVEVPAGTFETVHLARHSEDRSDRIEAWLAPALCGLPVKVRYVDEDRGVALENQLRKAVFD